jgi:hypothetical protein
MLKQLKMLKRRPAAADISPRYRRSLASMPARRHAGGMADGCYDLRDMTTAAIRLYCPDCHRFAQFNTARLLERFGPDQGMPGLLGKLNPVKSVAACQGRNASSCTGTQ